MEFPRRVRFDLGGGRYLTELRWSDRKAVVVGDGRYEGLYLGWVNDPEPVEFVEPVEVESC